MVGKFAYYYIHFIFSIQQDLNLYQESLQTLKIAQTKFQESAECAEKLESTQEGAPVLVPLTGSVSRCAQLCKNLNKQAFILLFFNRCMFQAK